MDELERILNCRDFKASQRSKDILRFVVQETLAGRDHALKGLLGRGEQGKPEVERLLQLKPDFKTQGHTLIRHHMKFEDTIERLVEGLALSGLVLE